VVRQVAGGEDLYPFGDTAGLIMYTPDGFMSAQLMRRGRPEFASGSWFDASDDELRAAASGYIAYSAPFHVDEKGTVTHKVWGLLVPELDRAAPAPSSGPQGDTLARSTADPIRSQGKDVYAYLTWRRTKLRRSHNSKLSFVIRDDVARDPAQPQRVPVELSTSGVGVLTG
jgi:hypothetical protein